MRRLILVSVILLAAAATNRAQDNPFLGRWDITLTTAKGTYPSWLEVRDDKGQLAGNFQDRLRQ